MRFRRVSVQAVALGVVAIAIGTVDVLIARLGGNDKYVWLAGVIEDGFCKASLVAVMGSNEKGAVRKNVLELLVSQGFFPSFDLDVSWDQNLLSSVTDSDDETAVVDNVLAT